MAQTQAHRMPPDVSTPAPLLITLTAAGRVLLALVLILSDASMLNNIYATAALSASAKMAIPTKRPI